MGIGSVCRRQATNEIGAIVTRIARERIRLHGFGVKTGGLQLYGRALVSSDSMAWSAKARRYSFETGRPSIPGHNRPGPSRPEGHASCSSCLEYALLWREGLLDAGLIDARVPSMAARPCGRGRPSPAPRAARETRSLRDLAQTPWEGAQVILARGIR